MWREPALVRRDGRETDRRRRHGAIRTNYLSVVTQGARSGGGKQRSERPQVSERSLLMRRRVFRTAVPVDGLVSDDRVRDIKENGSVTHPAFLHSTGRVPGSVRHERPPGWGGHLSSRVGDTLSVLCRGAARNMAAAEMSGGERPARDRWCPRRPLPTEEVVRAPSDAETASVWRKGGRWRLASPRRARLSRRRVDHIGGLVGCVRLGTRYGVLSI